ncbi:MAG: septation regulator SpoVG [Fusobacteriota bacterium]
MEITEVRLRLANTDEDSKLKAFADITFDNIFVIHGLKVIDGDNGMFVAMPSRRMPNGEFKDIAHPIKTEMRNSINETVIKEYEKALDEKE